MRFLRITLLSVALGSPLFGQGYSFQTLTIPGSTQTRVTSINNNGAVVGYYFPSTGGSHGFKRDPGGTYTYPINDPSGRIGTWPTGINQNGAIVGYFQGPPKATVHGFISGGVNGPFYTVDIKPGPWTAVLGINNRGDFAGGHGTMYPGSDLFTHAFVSINGTITSFTIPGITWITARGIAWDGSAVGMTFDGTTILSFVRGPKGNLLRFAADQASANGWTFASGINNEAGIIVGSYSDAIGGHGYIYRYVGDLASFGDSSGTALKTVAVETLDYPGATSTSLVGVNAKGEIAGEAVLPDFSRISFLATPN